MTANNVPLEVNEKNQDRSFAAMIPGAKAATQIAGSTSLPESGALYEGPVQPHQTIIRRPKLAHNARDR